MSEGYIWLTRREIEELHLRLLEQFGGTAGIRDDSLLESTLNTPLQTFGGEDLYEGIVGKAVRLGFGFVRNPPFVDGNKRIGTHAMLVTLALNGVELEYEPADLLDIIMRLASSQATEDDVRAWVEARIVAAGQ